MFKTYKQMQKACMCISCFVRPGKWLKRLCSLRLAAGLQLREEKDQVGSVAQSCPALCDPMEARQASLSITNTRHLPKLMSIESVMPSNHLILCCPLLLLPLIFPSIRVLSSESALPIRWPKYWSFSFNISPSSEHPGLISFRWTGWISLQYKWLSRVFSNTTVQKHQFFGTQPSSQSNSHIHTWPQEKP